MKRWFLVGVSALLVAALGVYAKQLVHETVQVRQPAQRYVVSLGDSVAAGAGLGDTKRQSADCKPVERAFPFLLGTQLHQPVEQFACSGATVAAVPGSTNNLMETQYTMAKPFLAGSDVVVTAGANDIGWLQALVSCTQTNCATTQTSTALNGKVRLLQQNLGVLLGELQQAHPHRLVVNTYYSLLAANDTCFARFGITPQKIEFINSEEMQLNAAITAAATKAGATVVPIDFSGHTLCSAEPWIQGILGNAPLHPTAAGQQQIARQDAQVFAAALAP